MKKVISLILTFAMILQIGVFAHGEFGVSEIMIDNMLYPIGESANGDGWKYENRTLTLENYNGGSIYSNATYETKDDVTIVLKGENTVNGLVDHKEYGSLIIKGDGSLKTNSLSGKNVILESGNVFVDRSLVEGATRLDYTTITVKKGAVLNHIMNNSNNILSSAQFIVDGGEVNLKNSSEGFYLHTTERVKISNGGKITVASDKGVYCTTDSNFMSVYSVTDVDGNELSLTGDPNFSRPLSNGDEPVKLALIFEKNQDIVNTQTDEKENYEEKRPLGEVVADEWAVPEIKNAYDNGFLATSLLWKDFKMEITRVEFAETVVLLYEKLIGEKAETESAPFEDISHLSDYMKDIVSKSYNLGFINGTDERTFAPDMLLTREQAAAILYRIYEKLGKGYEVSADAFNDDDKISDWAKTPVYFMVNHKILQGVGDNNFAPLANAQKQQAVAIAVRMFENLK